MTLAVDTLVLGPFWSDDPDRQGVGIIVRKGHALWTRTGEPYVPVKILNGDRASGGYHPKSLTALAYKAVKT